MASQPLISEDFLRRVTLPEGRDSAVYRDRRLTGFQLRLRRRGDGSVSKAFQVEYQGGPYGSKRRVAVIGHAELYTAADAREQASRLLKAAATGDDPKAERRAKRDTPTWQALVEEFEASHLLDKAPATVKFYKAAIRRNLTPAFKDMRVTDIGIEAVDSLKRRMKAHPVDCNRALAVLSVMFSLAVSRGWRSTNPVKGVKRYREVARQEWLDEHDLPKFLAILRERPSDPLNDLLRFLLVSGWRITEARLLDWSEIDIKRLQASIQTKTGRQTRQFSIDAATIVNRQPKRIGVVFTAKGGRPLDYKTVSKALAKLCAEAGTKPITLHGLRHTAASWAAIAGADVMELRQAFGWTGLAMPNRYVARADALGRQGAQKAADAVNVFGRPEAQVKPIPGRSA